MRRPLPISPTSFSVRDRAKAAEAYDQATSAYLSERYELAAHWFERAYRLVPTSTALLQAVRAHHKAGNSIRAANLALQLRDEYASDARSKQITDAVVGAVKPANVLVEAHCEKACTLELDGALIQHPTFFATPDVEHSLKVAFDNGETSTFLQGAAGTVKKVTLAAPAPPPPPPVPRWAFFSSLGTTVALGAVAAWSGIDANKGVSAYESGQVGIGTKLQDDVVGERSCVEAVSALNVEDHFGSVETNELKPHHFYGASRAIDFDSLELETRLGFDPQRNGRS